MPDSRIAHASAHSGVGIDGVHGEHAGKTVLLHDSCGLRLIDEGRFAQGAERRGIRRKGSRDLRTSTGVTRSQRGARRSGGAESRQSFE
jgi:hypothetical protein